MTSVDTVTPPGWCAINDAFAKYTDDGGLYVGREAGLWYAYGFAGAPKEGFAALPEACAAAERAYCGSYVGQVLSPGTAFMLGDVPAIALDPHQCGREAKMCGRPRSDNPCWPESTAWLEWDSGWLGATDISDPILGRNP